MPMIELYPLALVLPAGMKIENFEREYLAEGGVVYRLANVPEVPMVTAEDLNTIASVMEEAGIETPCLAPDVVN